jgi:hypothetical protein
MASSSFNGKGTFSFSPVSESRQITVEARCNATSTVAISYTGDYMRCPRTDFSKIRNVENSLSILTSQVDSHLANSQVERKWKSKACRPGENSLTAITFRFSFKSPYLVHRTLCTRFLSWPCIVNCTLQILQSKRHICWFGKWCTEFYQLCVLCLFCKITKVESNLQKNCETLWDVLVLNTHNCIITKSHLKQKAIQMEMLLLLFTFGNFW